MKPLLQSVVFLYLITGIDGLATMMYPKYNFVCEAPSDKAIRGLDIDCTGFVQCSGTTAFWFTCPKEHYFDGAVSCSGDKTKCPDIVAAAAAICPQHPELVFPHPQICSMFYNCSQTTARESFLIYEDECPFPKFFDSDSAKCLDPKVENVTCQAPKPVDQCSYRTECGQPSCAGLQDGPQGYTTQPFDVEYVICAGGQVQSEHRCQSPGEIFDPVQRRCTSDFAASIEPYCSANPTAKFADPTLCSLFYDCSAKNASGDPKLAAYQDECAYLYLFDSVAKSCQYYPSVMCGLRYEPIAPCNYSIAACYLRSTCLKCEESCVGMPDGDNIYPGKALTDDYLVCVDQRTINTKKCTSGQVFDPVSRLCAYEVGTDALDHFCASNLNMVIAHPGKCSQFYDCSKLAASGNFPKYLRECFYPELFDAVSGTCKAAGLVQCDFRTKPVTMCDYLQFQCVSTQNCALCPDKMPSCVGKPDGYWSLIGEEMTARYIQCQGFKFVKVLECPKGQIFDISARQCTSTLTTEAMTAYCALYPGTASQLSSVANPAHCGQYFECPAGGVGTAELLECPYPLEFSISGKICKPYPEVDCSERFEKLTPCDYATINPCKGDPACQCPLPSCQGRADGYKAVYPGVPKKYYTCRDGRTFITDCTPQPFDPSVGRCLGAPEEPTTTQTPAPVPTTTPAPVPTTTPAPSPSPTTTPATQPPPTPAPTPTDQELQKAIQQCQQSPSTEAIPHAVNCHWFYNCSNLEGVSECSYPYLFDSTSERCVEYSLASCMGAYKPQEMCEYDLYRSQYPVCQPNVFCSECELHHPSCVGKQDNFRAGLEIDPTQYYECRDNRTIPYQCTVPLVFDGSICSEPTTTPDEASTVAEASAYCIADQTAKIPHRDNCAKYYDCSNSRLAIEMECPYPKQFDVVTKTCLMTVACGTRAENKTPCSYESVVAKYPGCTFGQYCADCEISNPSCVGKVDGFRGAIMNDRSKSFECMSERTVIVPCSSGTVYIPAQKGCGVELDINTGMASTVAEASKYCAVDQTAKIPHRNNCARYFVCAGTLVAKEQECPYPQEFDAATKSCQMTVACGVRPEFKKPCAYLSVIDRYTNCEKGTPCPDCETDNPSCVGKPDGHKGAIVTDPSSYYSCLNERTIIDECAILGNIFLPSINKCGPDPTIPLDPLTPQNVAIECAQHPNNLYPMEGSCARYYDCRLGATSPLGPYIAECDYPLLFDGFEGRCTQPDVARCGLRNVEIDRCEYLSIRRNYCTNPGPCMTCVVENPSCQGKADLFIGGITINDAMFYTCLNSRTTISYCTNNQVFNSVAGQCRAPVVITTTPPTATQAPGVPIINPIAITAYCFGNKYAFAAHPDSCALYWNCSYAPNMQAPMYYSNYLMECRYPLYFNRITGACDENFASVDCGTRKEVITPCEFIAFTKALCNKLTSCVRCEEAQLSCRGKNDGFKAHMPRQTNQYFECRNQRTTIGTCPPGQLFDQILAKCDSQLQPVIPVMSTAIDAEPFCNQNPTAKYPHGKNCAQYFDCTVQNGPYGRYLSECVYPDLFDSQSSTCKDHMLVNCGSRFEPRLRCEYFAILTKYCRILGTKCPECDVHNPPCIAQNDGLTGALPDTRTNYYICMKDRTMIKQCQPTFEFDMATRKCQPLTHLSSSAQAEGFCTSNPQGMYPSILSCAQYFNCSQTTYGRFGRYLMECPYPDVYDMESRTCKDPSTVNCGKRPELKNPCEYMANMKMYTGRDCILPSCVGKMNGFHYYPSKELQRDYIECRDNRLVAVKTCPSAQYFDPVNRNCRVALTQSAVNFYCRLFPGRRDSNPLNCAQYINCNPIQAQLIECGYPRLYNGTQCVDPEMVNCEQRNEPVAPCEYAQNRHCPANQPNCPPCEERIPSCIGQQNGEVSYPNRAPSSLFVRCRNNRTISVIKCRSDLFNPLTSKCGGNFTTEFIIDVCKRYPQAIFADPSWCSRYYDCSKVVPRLLNKPFLQECRYPELFDVDKKCTNIFATPSTAVSCGLRYQPLDACEYFEHCGTSYYPFCANCTELIPSCRNKEDKRFYNYKNDPYSSQYYFCFKGRTVLYGKCRPSQRFDILNGGCLSNTVPLGTVYQTTTPSPPNRWQ